MSTWTTDKSTILKDGSPTFVAGVCYSPTPIGAATYEPGVGDWFTPPWNEIWERDFPLMKAAGINNIRTYFFWAWTPPRDMSTWSTVTSASPTFDHTAFLDAAAQNGISVTIGIALPAGDIFDNGDPTSGENFFQFYLATSKKLAELYGSHAAVMGFSLGNELNNPPRVQRPDYWDKLETIAKAVKAVAPDKLLMTCCENDGALFTYKIAGTSLTVPQRYAQIFDVWGLNIYGDPTPFLNNFNTDVMPSPDTIRPLIVSEWGIPGGTNVPSGVKGPPDGTATARELTSAEFDQHINNELKPWWQTYKSFSNFVAGTQYFEWTDEWWKNSACPPYEHAASKDPTWPEEWWGLNSIAPDPSRTPQEGPWNSKTNTPYPADVLTPRPTLAALTACYTGT